MSLPIEINGFLVYINASCCQKPKIENLILCRFYAHFMLVLCYKIWMRNLSISRPIDEIAHWNKRFSSLYQCLLLPETKNRKSNFMLILCSFYAGFMLQNFDAKFEDISAHRWESHWNKWFSSLYQCLLLPETKNWKSNFMLILCLFYAIMLSWYFDQNFMLLWYYGNLTKILC